MAEQSKDILSEYTKDMTPEQRAELQEKVSNMTEEELKEVHYCGGKEWMGQIEVRSRMDKPLIHQESLIIVERRL